MGAHRTTSAQAAFLPGANREREPAVRKTHHTLESKGMQRGRLGRRRLLLLISVLCLIGSVVVSTNTALACTADAGDTRPLLADGQAALPGNHWMPVLQFDVGSGRGDPARFPQLGPDGDIDPPRFWSDIYTQQLLENVASANTYDVTEIQLQSKGLPTGEMPEILLSVQGVVGPPGGGQGPPFDPRWISAVALAVDGRLAVREPLNCVLEPGDDPNVAMVQNAAAIAARRLGGIIDTAATPGASGVSNGYYDPADPIIAIYRPQPSDTSAIAFEFEPYQEFAVLDSILMTPPDEDGVRTITYSPGLVPGLDIITGEDPALLPGSGKVRRYFLLVQLTSAAFHGVQIAAGLSSVFIYQGRPLEANPDPRCFSRRIDLIRNIQDVVAVRYEQGGMLDRPITVVENTNDLTPWGQGADTDSNTIEDPFYPPAWPVGRWERRNDLRPPTAGEVQSGISFLRSYKDVVSGSDVVVTQKILSGQATPKVWEPDSLATQVLGLDLGGGVIDRRVDLGIGVGGNRTRLAGLILEFVSPGKQFEWPGDGVDNNGNSFWLDRNGIDDDMDSDDDNDANPYTAAVADGIDNDGDGFVDEFIDEGDEGIDEVTISPDMLEDNDSNPFNRPKADGIDNDGDGLVDEVHHDELLGDVQTPRPNIPVPEIKPSRNDDGDGYVEFFPGFPYSLYADPFEPTGNLSMRFRLGSLQGSGTLPERLFYRTKAGLVQAEYGWMGLFDPSIDLPVTDLVEFTPPSFFDPPPVLGQLDPYDRVNTQGMLGNGKFEISMDEFIRGVRGMRTPAMRDSLPPFGRVLRAMDDDRDGIIDEDIPDQLDNDGDGFIDEDGYNWQLVNFDDDLDQRIDEDGEDGFDNDGDGLIDEDVTWSPIAVLVEEESPNYFVDGAGGTRGVYDPGIDQLYIDFNGNGHYDRAFGNGTAYDRDEFVYPGVAVEPPVLDALSGPPKSYHIYALPLDDDGDAESATLDRIDNDGDSEDPDHDGFPTGQEIVVGTDPYPPLGQFSRPDWALVSPPMPPWLYIDEGFNEDQNDADFDADDLNEDIPGHSDLDGLQLWVDGDGGNVESGNGQFSPGNDVPISKDFFFIDMYGAYNELAGAPLLAGRFGAYIPVALLDGRENDGNGTPWSAIPRSNDGKFDFFVIASLDTDDSHAGAGRPWLRQTGLRYGDDWMVRLSRGGVMLRNFGAPAIARNVQNIFGCEHNDGIDDPGTLYTTEPYTLLGPRPLTASSGVMDGRPDAAVISKRQIGGLHILDVHGFQSDLVLTSVSDRTVRDGADGPANSRFNQDRAEVAFSGAGHPFIAPLHSNVPVLALNVAIAGATSHVPIGFTQETIRSIRVNFISVDTEGKGKFEPTDLAPLHPNSLLSGIGLIRDGNSTGGLNGYMDQIEDTPIRLNIEQSGWDLNPRDPVVLSGGHYVVLTPEEPIGPLPQTDYLGEAGPDLFIVCRGSASADYHDAFQMFIRPGDIDFRNSRNGSSSFVISDPYAFSVPVRYDDMLPGGKTVAANSSAFAVVGLDMVDANATFRGAPSKLQAVRVAFFDAPCTNCGPQAPPPVRFNPETDLVSLTNEIVNVSEIRPDLFPPAFTSPLRLTTLSGVALFRDAPGSDTPGGFDDPLDPTVQVPDTPVLLSGDEEFTDIKIGSESMVWLFIDPPSEHFDPDQDGIFHTDQSIDRRGIPGGESSRFDNVDLTPEDIFDPPPYEPLPPSRGGEYVGPDFFVVLRTSNRFSEGKRFRVSVRPFDDAEFSTNSLTTYPYLLNAEARPYPMTLPALNIEDVGGILSSVIVAGRPFNAAPAFTFITPPPFVAGQPPYEPPRPQGNRLPPVRILWDDSDPDDAARITLRILDLRTNEISVLASGINEDLDGPAYDSYNWDISRLTPGLYQVRAEISDGTNPVVVAFSQHVRVTNDLPTMVIYEPRQLNPPAAIPSGERFRTTWNAFDYENDAQIALWLDPSPTRPSETAGPGPNAVPVVAGISEDLNGLSGYYDIPISDLFLAGLVDKGKEYYVVAAIDDGVRRLDTPSGTGLVYAVSRGKILINTTVVPTPTPTPSRTTTPTPVPPSINLRIAVGETPAQLEPVLLAQRVNVEWADLIPQANQRRTLYWLEVGEPVPLIPAFNPPPPASRILRNFAGEPAACLTDTTVGSGRFEWDFGDVPAGTYRVLIQSFTADGREVRVVSANTISIPRLRWPLRFAGYSFQTPPLLVNAMVGGEAVPVIVTLSTNGLLQAFDANGMRLERRLLGTSEVFFSAPVAVDLQRNGRPLVVFGGDREQLVTVDLLAGLRWARLPAGGRGVVGTILGGYEETVVCNGNAGQNRITAAALAQRLDTLTRRSAVSVTLSDVNPGAFVEATAAVGDFDGDAVLDLVVGSFSGWAYLLSGQTQTGAAPFVVRAKFNLGAPIEASPVVGDLTGADAPDVLLSNNRGELFIVADPARESDPGRLRAQLIRRLNGSVRSTPVLANLNGSGKDEILVAVAGEGQQVGIQGRVYALNGEGGNLLSPQQPQSEQALSDLVVPRSNVPVTAALAVGRLNGDERPELVVASQQRLFIYGIEMGAAAIHAASVSLLASLPGEFSLGSPVIGDLAGGSPRAQEIVIGGRRSGRSEELLLLGLESGAENLVQVQLMASISSALGRALTPRETTSSPAIVGAPALADVDGDNSTDLVMAAFDGTMAVVSPRAGTGQAPGLDWPQFKANEGRTGRYEPSNGRALPIPGDLNGDRLVDYRDILYLADHWARTEPATGMAGSGLRTFVDGEVLLRLIEVWQR